ncbi:STAS domain-containing protein [Streptosporangium canum]|uniref:STAS domain-containing protein n=1 Tax=Streptosporangium canum TaxID=324952 RepID=UPI003413B538
MTLITVISQAAGDDRAEISVYGDLDAVTGPELRRVMAGHTAAHLVLDLAHVGFLDCAGARTLLWADGHVCGRGGVMVIRNPSDLVLRLLRLLRFDRHLLIRQSGDAARVSDPPVR